MSPRFLHRCRALVPIACIALMLAAAAFGARLGAEGGVPGAIAGAMAGFAAAFYGLLKFWAWRDRPRQQPLAPPPIVRGDFHDGERG